MHRKQSCALNAILLAIFPGFTISLGIDAVSTLGIERWIPSERSATLIRAHFLVAHVHNAGLALGFSSTTPAWSLVTQVAAALLLLLLLPMFMVYHGLPPEATWPFGMALGGGLGNLLDRAIEGRVTDYLGVSLDGLNGVTFNLGDVSMIAGVFFLALTIFLAARAAHDLRIQGLAQMG